MCSSRSSLTIVLASAVALLVVLLPARATASSASAERFGGDVCGLLSAKLVATVHAPAKCTNRPTIHGAGSTTYYGTWGSIATFPNLSVSVVSFQSKSALQTAESVWKGRTATRLAGVGVTYETHVGKGAVINFFLGSDEVTVTLQPTKALKSLTAFDKLAQAIAREV
jgi:hypothetical protein